MNSIRRKKSPQPHPPCILVVEDDDVLRATVARLLESEGYTVLTAAGRGQAVQCWERHHAVVDLVFMDMMLPDGNGGPDMAAEFKKKRPGLKVLYSSGQGLEDAPPPGVPFEAWEHMFVQKPYNAAELLGKIRRLLEEK